MKCELKITENRKMVLEIRSETHIESIALWAWSKNLPEFQKTRDEKSSILLINYSFPENKSPE